MPEDSVPESEPRSLIETPISRRALLALGALAGIALTLPSLPAQANFAYGDIRELLILEEVAQIEADFFNRASRSVTAEGMKEHESNVLALIAEQDAQVARWFKAAKQQQNLGAELTFFTPNTSTSRPIPVYQFDLDTFKTRDALLATAISIKSTAVGGFHGAVGDANSPKLVQALAALAGVQGRHLAVLQEISGQNPFVATEMALSRFDVAQNFEGYGFKREVLI